MNASLTILAVNAGSSSLKFRLYEIGRTEELLLAGAVEGIGQGPARLWFGDGDGGMLAERDLGEVAHERAIGLALAALGEMRLPSIEAVGHRVVHGGPLHRAPEMVTPALLQDLRCLVAWAPLHMPPSLNVIDALRDLHPDWAQCACFDTAFHAGLPEVARRLALPRHLFDEGVQKYGFHGLSYEYVLGVLGDRARGRLIVAHLGNGASMVACRDGAPVDTTMGMTPMGGFMMGTRPGDLDPGVLLHLIRERGYDIVSLERLLDQESGLKGVSDITADMKDLLARRAAGERQPAQAVEMFCYQARKTIGALAAALGGLDRLVFTGGIGENSEEIRRLVCGGLAHLGIGGGPVSAGSGAKADVPAPGRCEVEVVHTDEDLMIARHAHALLVRSDEGGAARAGHGRKR